MRDIFKRKSKEALVDVIEEGNPQSENINFSPAVASVNVIPVPVLNYYKVLQVRNRAVAAAVVIALCFAGLFVYFSLSDNATNVEIADIEARTQGIQNQASELSGYQKFYDEVTSARKDMGQRLANHTDVGKIMGDVISAANSSGVTLDSVSLTASNSEGGGGLSICPSPDPFGSYSSAGCVNFDGYAGSRAEIASFTDALNAVEGLKNAYIPSSAVTETEDKGARAAVSGSVAFTSHYYTSRYSDLSINIDSDPEDTPEKGEDQ